MVHDSSYFQIRGIGLPSALLRLFTFIRHSMCLEIASGDFEITYKRLAIFIAASVVLPILIIWNHIGFWFDDILFYDWRNQSVVTPMFIVGNARSGTTWLHRLISHDSETFTTFKTWEIIFAVSITWRWLFHTLHALDQHLLFGLISGSIQDAEIALFSHIKVHPIGLNKVEEDDWLLIHIAMSQLVTFFYPVGGAVLSDLIMFDYVPPAKNDTSTTPSDSKESNNNNNSKITSDGDNSSSCCSSTSTASPQPPATATATEAAALSKAVRMEIFQFYKECVQRHLYYHRYFIQPKNATIPKDKTDTTSSCTADDNAPINSSSSHSGSYNSNRHSSGNTNSSGTDSTHSNSSGTDSTHNSRQVIFVSKNPAFTLRIETLYDTFPDCRVVCLLRNPVESVPSMVSYISMVWHAFASPTAKYPKVADLLGFCEAHYLYPLSQLQTHKRPECQWSFLSYHSLLSDLEQTLLELLDRLYPSPESIALALAQAKAAAEAAEAARKAQSKPRLLRRSNSDILRLDDKLWRLKPVPALLFQTEVNTNLISSCGGTGTRDSICSDSDSSSDCTTHGGNYTTDSIIESSSYHHTAPTTIIQRGYKQRSVSLYDLRSAVNDNTTSTSNSSSHHNGQVSSHSPPTLASPSPTAPLGPTPLPLIPPSHMPHTPAVKHQSCSRTLRAYLQEEQIKARHYRGSHVHSVEMCCGGMTTEQLQESLKSVYEVHGHAFNISS